ncbi:hypothetical protein QBC38DRAFT_452516 [Podospora fimiseda]|uniref:Tudor domain-containing protein n=1 Tax=Podospora fimiseda TaxID=252190 RepID=A0AAN7BV09_9PEZI|nr:hypothetical protein QBC38DRAFT_452516 [Podospora fimiseda]
MSAQLEAEKKEFESQLELVISSLKDDPDNSELVTLKTELEGMIQFINDSIAELKPKPQAAAPKAPAAKPVPPVIQENPPKWSRENHPAFKKTDAPPPPPPEEPVVETVVTYQVNDTVMAKWATGDKGFYPARITSVTGSKTAPIYTVKFKSYDTVETLRGKDIRPIQNGAGQKRKAEEQPAVGSASASANSGIVMSATPELYPKPIEENEKPRPKFKKIKATKELEAGKNKWQEFTAKGGKGGMKGKKDSMFRTPDGVKGRVGFTGSGQAMRKDPTRTRHVYQPNEDLD